ncbi:MAG: PBP1A family penicillin-binding protein [Actinobacteria bacterium]|nr:PBP1A family penicillin-binding protein [Actinomycetota bacterium]
MKRFLLAVLSGLLITILLANTFASEASEFVGDEKETLIRSAQRSYIYANDGKTILARLYLENREDVPLDNVPQHVQEAVIAIEDERYYEHNGVDYYGIARALLANLKSHRIVEGGSTITQQYIKNTIGSKDKTLTRKLEEAIVAYRLEKKYSKKQILEAYLNTIYFGQGAYGIEAAAEVFFGKKAHELTLSEGALLAGLTKSPLRLSPYYNPDRAFKRQAVVLNRMVNLGFITEEEAEEAKKERPKIMPRKNEEVIAPYFVEYVKQMLIKEYGVDKVFRGGLRIHTTLNVGAQRNAERAISTTLNRKNDPEAALVSIDPRNGHIIAMVGGRDFENIKYNLAVQGKRQPGSSFKAFVLVTALEQGYKPEDTFKCSSVIYIPGLKKPWKVRGGSSGGTMTLRQGTVKSVNTFYANTIMVVGPKNVANTAHKMGIKTPIDPIPPIALGGLTIGVSPLEMASAYGTLANSGIHVEPTPVNRIEDFDGNVIKEVTPEGKQVIDKQVAYLATDVLQGVIQRGTATRANIGRPAAGKTGTNAQFRDAWFIGYTPNMVTAVWMGYPQAQISMHNVHGSRGFGGIIPATIWQKYMSSTLRGTQVLDFPKPTGSTSTQTGSSWTDKAKSYIRKGWNRSKKKATGSRAPQPSPQPPASPPNVQPTPPTTSPPPTANQNQQNRGNQSGNDRGNSNNSPQGSTQNQSQQQNPEASD